jgi:catechol 2,3-dioxygenase-like lactoylglutathione lyase family enzyme
MIRQIAHLTFLVRDYDEALAYFTRMLDFSVVEDSPLGNGKRWVLVSPPGAPGLSLLLAKATTPAQQAAVGRQAGGRVFLFLHTDDFHVDCRKLRSRGVRFAEEPRAEAYGHVAVFEDLYGNKWDLLERQNPAPSHGEPPGRPPTDRALP